MNNSHASRAKRKETAHPKPATSAPPPDMIMRWTAVFLWLATLLLYWPTLQHDFINVDDNLYLWDNAHVKGGLTWANIAWALFSPDESFGYWHPLTLLSHMLDCQLYGLDPWGHHLTSVLLHATNSALLFLLLHRMSGALVRSALVAAFFAAHPLHVESVAWIAERKDVLSTCFGFLALYFYAGYAERQTRGDMRAKTAYRWTLLAYLLSLICKPTLVTLPFLLLLLDYWPLKRFSLLSMRQLLREKIPFFILAACISVVTIVFAHAGHSMRFTGQLSLYARISNTLIAYCRYLQKTFWPVDLALGYSHSDLWSVADVQCAGILLAAIMAIVWILRRRYPFALVGWLWFVGTLVPMIGLVQVGNHQAVADRYMYIPLVGMGILLVWGGGECANLIRQGGKALTAVGVVAVALCVYATRDQLGYWQNSETLLKHAIQVTPDNFVAHEFLGQTFAKHGDIKEAILEYRESIRANPYYGRAYYNLGVALLKQGEAQEAMTQFQVALRLDPDEIGAYGNLAILYARQGQYDAAVNALQQALKRKPDYAGGHHNLGMIYLQQGKIADAIRELKEALRLNPNDTFAQRLLEEAQAHTKSADPQTK